MKEYSLRLKYGNEEHSNSLRIIKNLAKENQEEDVSQIFSKTYKLIDRFWEETEVVLLFCEFQKINKGIKFKR